VIACSGIVAKSRRSPASMPLELAQAAAERATGPR
jgi:hypothetical protein